MPINGKIPRFLSATQVSRIVGRSERWVQVLCGRGHIQAHRVGPRGTWQIRPQELEKSFGLTADEVRKGYSALRRKASRSAKDRKP